MAGIEDILKVEVPKVHIPLPLQVRLYYQGSLSAADTIIRLMDGDSFNHLEELGLQRLKEGQALYGSTMYGWTPQTRLQNVREELADALVYLTSGEYLMASFILGVFVGAPIGLFVASLLCAGKGN